MDKNRIEARDWLGKGAMAQAFPLSRFARLRYSVGLAKIACSLLSVSAPGWP
jgi:hypothetical protein